MSRKKALSILLACAMAFTSNVMAFADDVTTSDDSVAVEASTEAAASEEASAEEVVAESADDETVDTESTYSENQLSDLEKLTTTVSFDTTVNGLFVKYKAGVYYTGNKPTMDDMDVYFGISDNSSPYNGCYVPVSSVKFTSSNKKNSGEITFKIKSLKGYGYVVSANDVSDWYDAQSKETVDTENAYVGDSKDVESTGLSTKQAKAALKALKALRSTIKDKEYKMTIVPETIYEAYDKDLLPKSGKKVSYECYVSGEKILDNDVASSHGLEHTVAVKIKNGTVKAVYYLDTTDYCESIRLQNGSTIKAQPAPKNTFYQGYVGKYKLQYKTIAKKFWSATTSGNNIILKIDGTSSKDNYAVSANLIVKTSK